ncbi:MAG TPA: hypothetical protein DD706_14190, partial [Nitrospiraceae bacterium]|nr:hypothetical protein [Nitrospiraceae bacterium]
DRKRIAGGFSGGHSHIGQGSAHRSSEQAADEGDKGMSMGKGRWMPPDILRGADPLAGNKKI